MLETTKIYLSTSSSDLSCPICYCTFGLEENQPISTNCGHTICSVCFDRVSKCPFCKERFDKRRQKHNKSVFISSLIANSSKINACKEHSEICQGFCLQEKAFVCFDCVMKNHQGHKIITIKEIHEKAEKARIVLQKARKKKESKQLELRDSLESESKRQKRQLDEIIDQEISHLSMLKKKLYKEVDVRIMTENEHYEHKLLSENLSKHCNSIEKLLGDWNQSQEVGIAAQILEVSSEEIQGVQSFETQIELFKTEITRKHLQCMSEIRKNLNSLQNSSAKFKKLFAPNKKIGQSQSFPHVELDYLINVLSEYNLTASQKNGVLELKIDNPAGFTPKFDPNYFTCLLPKLSLRFLDTLPSVSFVTICQVFQNIQALQDVTLHFQSLAAPDLSVLFHLISNLKPLEKFHVQMNLTGTEKPAVSQFTNELLNLKNLFSIEIQHKESQTIISFQLIPSTIMRKPFEVLQEISLNLGGIPEIVCETLNTLNSNKASTKPLEILRLSLGKTDCDLQVVEAVCKTLELQSDLEELTFTCEDLNDSIDSDLLLFLSAMTQKKKLGIFVKQVSLPNGSFSTKILPKEHPDFEEFTLKIKYEHTRNCIERFECLVDFLSTSKSLKKLCLQFDGVYTYFDPVEKLFSQIIKLEGLVSLEMEFLNVFGLNSYDQRDLEAVLNQLPASVAKRFVFQRSNSREFYNDNYLLDPSEYSEDEMSYRENDEEEEDEDYY